MPQRTPDFTAALESYLRHLAADRHAAVPETSRYGYLQTLLNAAGAELSGAAVCPKSWIATTGGWRGCIGLFD